MEPYAVGFARPDRRWAASGGDPARPWHAVPAHRPLDELDGEVELAACGVIVEVWGSQRWRRVRSTERACAACVALAVPQ